MAEGLAPPIEEDAVAERIPAVGDVDVDEGEDAAEEETTI